MHDVLVSQMLYFEACWPLDTLLEANGLLTSSAWRIQRGFHGFHRTPLLKGYLRKYYAQTYYVHYAHTGATHFSFNSSITQVCQLLYQEFDARMAYVTTICIVPSAARDSDMLSVWGLITFTPFHVPCHMTHKGGGAARCRVKAAVHHTASPHKVFVTF